MTKVDCRGIRVVAFRGAGQWQACAVGYSVLSDEHSSAAAAVAEVCERIDDMLENQLDPAFLQWD